MNGYHSTANASKPARASRRSGAHLRVAQAPVERQKRAPRPLGVVDQVRAALRPQARLASLLGAPLGGFVPVASFVVARHELERGRALYGQLGAWLVLGGLLYSATTVYAWGREAFRSPVKATGFVVLLEGVLVGSRVEWLAFAALAYLVAINAVATGCTLSRRGAL
jgi:hypothetical protein